MRESLSRLELLIGENALNKIQNLRIIIFGLGGVGSVCAESLVRSGVSHLTLVDSDNVNESNINRQLPALYSTIGNAKVDVLAKRFLDINPSGNFTALNQLYTPENKSAFHFENYDIVIDAIDSLANKIDLLISAHEAGARVYCSLGAAGKLDPTKIRTASIWETHGCDLGKLLRGGLRKRNFSGDFKAVYSEEKTIIPEEKKGNLEIHGQSQKAVVLGSAMPVTAAFGLALSSLIIRDILE